MDWHEFSEEEKKRQKISEVIGTQIMGFKPVNTMLFLDVNQKPSKILRFNPVKYKEDAWLIIERFDFFRIGGYGEFYKVNLSVAETDGTYSDAESQSETVTMAICLAALKAFDIKIEGVTE